MPRCLPVRSAGPRDVQHVVEQLEREPDPLAELPQQRDVAATGQRAQLARGAEEPRGLQIAATQVALARRVEVPRVLALQQLALHQRRRRVRQARAPARPFPRRRVRRTRARTADRRSRSRSSGRRWPRPSAGRAAGRRRRARRRAPAWRNGRARPRPRPAARRRAPPGPARRRRRPAAAAGACRPRRSSRRRARRASTRATSPPRPGAASRSRISPGTCAPPASTTAATASADATYATVPWWIAMIPPAVRIQPTSRQPASTSVPRQRVRVREALHGVRKVGVRLVEAAQERHQPIEPQREERGQGRLLRGGDLEDHDAPARLDHARHLRQPAREVAEVAGAEAHGRRVEGIVRIRAAPARRPAPRSSPAPSCAPARASRARSQSRRRHRRARRARSPGRRCRSPRPATACPDRPGPGRRPGCATGGAAPPS